jgi:hypothetical protein
MRVLIDGKQNSPIFNDINRPNGPISFVWMQPHRGVLRNDEKIISQF